MRLLQRSNFQQGLQGTIRQRTVPPPPRLMRIRNSRIGYQVSVDIAVTCHMISRRDCTILREAKRHELPSLEGAASLPDSNAYPRSFFGLAVAVVCSAGSVCPGRPLRVLCLLQPIPNIRVAVPARRVLRDYCVSLPPTVLHRCWPEPMCLVLRRASTELFEGRPMHIHFSGTRRHLWRRGLFATFLRARVRRHVLSCGP